ncbi:MAG: ferredoxin [Desulfovibrionaceae bacterium]|jgi:NADP-reducing hydrogenase subunit HndB
MTKITSYDELRQRCADVKAQKAALAKDKIIINVSLATCSIAAGGKKALQAIEEEVAAAGLQDAVMIMKSGCMTYCYAEPTVEIAKPGAAPVVFGDVDEAKARALVTDYIVRNEPVEGVIPVNYVRVAF